MTVKINIAPEYKKAELGKYGVFKIRPLGAGEDLQLSLYSRQLGDLVKELEGLNPKDKKMTKKEIDAALEKVNAATRKAGDLRGKMVEIVKSQVEGVSVKGQVERLFNELPLVAIRDAISEVLNG